MPCKDDGNPCRGPALKDAPRQPASALRRARYRAVKHREELDCLAERLLEVEEVTGAEVAARLERTEE